MLSLHDLGFCEGIIYETIVSAYRVDGKAHAAPMGVVIMSDSEFTIRPYKSARTYGILRLQKCGVVNIVNDPILFFKSAFKELLPGRILPPDLFDRARAVSAPRLIDADAYVEFTVRRVLDESAERGLFFCEAALSETNVPRVKPYCRSAYATMESVLHATRIRALRKRPNLTETDRLIALINHHRDTILRVSPSSENLAIVDKLLAQAYAWRNHQATGKM